MTQTKNKLKVSNVNQPENFYKTKFVAKVAEWGFFS